MILHDEDMPWVDRLESAVEGCEPDELVSVEVPDVDRAVSYLCRYYRSSRVDRSRPGEVTVEGGAWTITVTRG